MLQESIPEHMKEIFAKCRQPTLFREFFKLKVISFWKKMPFACFQMENLQVP